LIQNAGLAVDYRGPENSEISRSRIRLYRKLLKALIFTRNRAYDDRHVIYKPRPDGGASGGAPMRNQSGFFFLVLSCFRLAILSFGIGSFVACQVLPFAQE